jgi:integrase
MDVGKVRKKWERTNVTNLLRNGQSGTYYARVKVNGKEKWRTLKTKVFSVAKLKLGDVEREERAKGFVASAEALPQGGETTVERFINIYLARTKDDPALRPATKSRREIAVKAILKTWRDLPLRDARRITPKDCRQWAASALRNGTGFVAPKAKTVRRGMSSSSFNKCVDTLRAIFEVAREYGITYQNPAEGLSKAGMRQKRLELPSVEQFHAIVRAVAKAGARQSKDCADMVRLLAYSGARLAESSALRWRDLNMDKGQLTIAGTKSESSYRVIPVFPPLAGLLNELRKRRGVEPADGPILRVRECKGSLRSACINEGVKPITHHDLRHLFATRCIESGVDIPTVSRWLGHSDGGALAMRTYGHLRQEHSAAQAAKVHF